MGGQLHVPAALPSEKELVTYCLGGWIGPTVGVGTRDKRKPLPIWELNTGYPGHNLSLYRLSCA
jgi:hypothetical protein